MIYTMQYFICRNLEMICTPQRNSLKHEHLETLLLLATLKIPVKESYDYSKEMELLGNS